MSILDCYGLNIIHIALDYDLGIYMDKIDGYHRIKVTTQRVSEKGVKLTTPAMDEVEKQLHRLPTLPNWFVEILPKSA